MTQFYSHLLGSAANHLMGVDVSVLRAGPQLSARGAASLVLPVSHEEIDRALASINDAKAPGVDGFNAFFFKKAWVWIKQDVYAAVLEFFKSGTILKQFNCTSVTLVPKVQNPTLIKDYRPIACCTMVYKLIAKVLNARLQAVIGEVVDQAQSGSIPQKHIADNILLATERV